MVKCVFRPQFHLGKNRMKNHSLKTEKSWTCQYHQAEKETLKELVTHFRKYPKLILRNPLLEFTRYKNPVLNFF